VGVAFCVFGGGGWVFLVGPVLFFLFGWGVWVLMIFFKVKSWES